MDCVKIGEEFVVEILIIILLWLMIDGVINL